MKEYLNFVVQNSIHMEKSSIVSDFKTFLENQVQSETQNDDGKEIKMFYTVETKRIQIPVGSDISSKDNKRVTFDKIFRRIKKVSKFIKVPEPILTLIEKKKYFACCHPTEGGITYDRKSVPTENSEESKNVVVVYTNMDEASKRCEVLNKNFIKNRRKHGQGHDETEPWRVVSKEVEEYDLKMATVLKPEDEWLILGTIDHKDGLLKAAPSQQVPINLVPDQMIGSSYCDHCHKTIYRNKTVFVQNLKTKDILRVGGSCIRNYLGYDYEKVLAYLTDISFLDETFGGFDGGGWDDEFGGGFGGRAYDIEISTTEVIRYFYWFYKKNGYMSKATADKINQKKQEESGEESTGEESYNNNVKEVKSTSGMVQADVTDAHTPPDRKNFTGRNRDGFESVMRAWEEFVEKYEERCNTTTDEEVQLVINFIHDNRDNNFIFNASNMIKNGSVQKHLLYYVTGACSWYFGKLAQEDRKKREAEEALSGGKKESEFVGTIGEKMKLENLEVVHVGGFETMYGWSNVYKLKDQIGNIYTKFGVIGTQFIVKPIEQGRTKDSEGNLILNNILVGDLLSATAEIKKHDEYKGTKQTTLGRFSKL